MFKKILKNDDGFTLVETLISIAALALISGFILQMFMVSSNANTKAQNIDKASAEAINVIETIKSFKNYDELYNNNFFDNLPPYDAQGANTYCFWYDKDWSIVKKSGYINDDQEQYPDSCYALKLTISEKDGKAGKMINIAVEVYQLDLDIDKRELASYEASKYFFAD